MTKKQQIKSIIIIALPLMAAFLAQRAMQFIDTVMMGWLGPTALAAGALGTAIYITTIIACMGALSAVGVFIARDKGANNIAHIKDTLQHGFYLALLLSIPSMIFIWFSNQLLLVIGEDPLVVADTRLLLHGLVWGFPGFLFFIVLREFISAFALTLIIMLVCLFSIPLTFILNYLLIYGKFHFPALGIAGIGYGGAIVMWIMFFALLVYCKKHSQLKPHLVCAPLKFDRDKFSDLLHIGIPSGALLLLEAGMFLATTILMGYFGVTALAAHQIAMQCVNIAYTIPLALSVAAAIQVGHAAGAKNFTQAKDAALLIFGIVILFSILFAILFIFSANYLVLIFVEPGAGDFELTARLAILFLHISALFLCFDALQSVANGALRGLKDTFVPMLLSIACYWLLGVGSAYYLSMKTELGAKGIWYGLTFGLSSTAIILVIRFFYKWKSEKEKSKKSIR